MGTISDVFFGLVNRVEAFSSVLGRHRHAHHLEQMPIADIGGVVNTGAALPYSSTEIMSILKVHHMFNY